MTQPITPDQLAASGAQIELSNGTVLTLRYTFSALAEIEKEHGSVNALIAKLKAGADGSVFGALGQALWAGTQRKMPLAAFLDLLSPAKTPQYSTAFGAALNEAMGTPSGEAKAAEPTAA